MSRSEKPRIDKPLTDPPPIPEASIDSAVEVLRSARLFRYGEDTSAEPHAALLEAEFAAYVGTKYCVALNSGGGSMCVALRATGVEHGTPVLFNAFTLAPVPGSIAHAGGEAVAVEVRDDWLIDLDHLAKRARETGARHLMLSHMRGHITDLERLCEVCDELEVTVIEDCAHTMGARWNGRMTGTFGAVGCFSTQTFKHVNSGEGGLLVTDDDEIAAASILYSGSYSLYEQHGARPPLEVIERLVPTTPNYSLRMSNLAAAILRPQLKELPARAAIWKARYDELAGLLEAVEGVRIPTRDAREDFVPSSIQFSLPSLSGDQILAFMDGCADRGVFLKWFGRAEPLGFTGRREHWQYIRDPEPLPGTSQVLATLLDMRIPLSLTPDDCRIIAAVIRDELEAVRSA